jgi:hypothetical protein
VLQFCFDTFPGVVSSDAGLAVNIIVPVEGAALIAVKPRAVGAERDEVRERGVGVVPLMSAIVN